MNRRKRGENITKYTKEEFIKIAQSIYGDYYDYSLVNYVNIKTKVDIICPIHGVFRQSPDCHLSGRGCYLCGRKQSSKKQALTTEEVIKRFKDKYGDIDDYSKVKYVNSHTPVCIITPEYGEIWKIPSEYLKSRNVGERQNWTIEKALKVAQKFDNRKDLIKNCGGAYYFLKRNKVKLDWLKPSNREVKVNKEFCIYTYEDDSTKTVYVGLSYDVNNRHKEHLRTDTDTARLYFERICKNLPNPKIRMEELDAENAQYYEDWYVNAYKKAGWNVLNKARTGVGTSSLGGDPIWTREKCIEVISKCKSRNEFRIKYGGAYSAVRRYGWEDIMPDKIMDRKSRMKPLNQYDMDMNFIKRYDAIKDVPYQHGNIIACCRGRRQTAYGYKWSYAV